MIKHNFEIQPYIGIGIVQFGMSRGEVRTLLPGSVSTFKKGLDAITLTDAYDELGLHLFYDSSDRLECIDAWGPCPISYKGVQLLGVNLAHVLKGLADLGLDARYDDGYFFDQGGFVLDSSPEEIVQTVTVYRRGYYD